MSRAEFTKQTKRDAFDRANGHCEAVGVMYGLDPGRRCNFPFGTRCEYDHVILDANSKDNSLSNCACVCIPCHEFKTRKHDIPKAAKTVRQQDKDRNIRSGNRGFQKPPPGYNPWTRRIET